jgi:Ca2+-binding RTX toxin-like protein
MNQTAPRHGRIQKYGLRTFMLGAVVSAQTVLVTTPAQATTDVFPNVNVLAAQGKTNNITISLEGDFLVIRDSGDTILGSAGCATAGDSARCPAAGVPSIVVGGESGNDKIRMDPSVGIRGQLFGDSGRDRLFGGNGNDTLQGGSGDDDLFGGNGDDALQGGSDDDKLDGGLGNDTLRGGPGKDILRGGPGFDTCFRTPRDSTNNCEVVIDV